MDEASKAEQVAPEPKKSYMLPEDTLMPPIIEEKELPSSELSFSEHPKNPLTAARMPDEQVGQSLTKSNASAQRQSLALDSSGKGADAQIKEQTIEECSPGSQEQPKQETAAQDEKLLMASISQRIDMYDKQMDGQDSVGFADTIQVREQTFDERANPLAGAIEAAPAQLSLAAVLNEEEKEQEPPPLEKERS